MTRATCRLAALALVASLASAVAAVGEPETASASSEVCSPQPTHLTFTRAVGHARGLLRWRLPAGVHARVQRNGRVVGQTAGHAMRIAVTVGRTYRFDVIPLHDGIPSACVASRTIHVRYQPPSAPRALKATQTGGTVRLSWGASRRGDGRLAGYRLLRDGAVVGQTAHTAWRLRVATDRTYRFAVVAVDSRGHRSAPSKSVTVAIGGTVPGTPSGVEAFSTSGTEIGARWQPAGAGSGRIAGYRVLRDGAVVKQVAGTSIVLDHLAEGTTYRISVAAVDSRGHVSAPSAPVSVRTQDPLPTAGNVHAYLLASTDRSFDDFRAHYRSIGFVYPTYFDCTLDADLRGRDDPLITRWAQARRVRVMPRVNCQRTTVIHRILTDGPTRAHWLDALATLAEDQGYDGISLDFEAGAAADRAALTSFVADLADRLHGLNKLLTVAVSPKAADSLTHPRSGIFDYPRLSESADYLFVLGWGLHWTTSAPGAPDDLAWATTIVNYVKSLPLAHKFVYGTDLYALDWPAGGGPTHPATAIEYDDFVPRIAALGATTRLDPATDAFHATYTDANGVAHDVWYPDAGTVGDRIRLAETSGLGGIGFWRLGDEDQRLWDDPQIAPGAIW